MSPAVPAEERVLSEILVVEDNPITRKLLQAALAADGYEVSAVARASEVDAALQGGAPDLVLLDLMLPDATGFDVLTEVTAAIREHVAPPFCGRTITRPELPSKLHREVIGGLERQADRDADAARATRSWRTMLDMLERVCDLSETSRDLVEFFDELLAGLLDASGFSLGLIYTCDRRSFALRSDLGFANTTRPGPSEFFGQPDMLQHAIDGQQPVALDQSSVWLHSGPTRRAPGVQSRQDHPARRPSCGGCSPFPIRIRSLPRRSLPSCDATRPVVRAVARTS